MAGVPSCDCSTDPDELVRLVAGDFLVAVLAAEEYLRVIGCIVDPAICTIVEPLVDPFPVNPSDAHNYLLLEMLEPVDINAVVGESASLVSHIDTS